MMTLSAKTAIYLSVPVAIGASLLPGMHGTTLEDVHFAVRATATVGFVYFVVVYFARPLRDAVGIRSLIRYRRTLGLAVALAMTVHFLFLIWFFSLSDESVFDDQLRLYTGALAVGVLYAMAATSNNAAARALGPRWKQVHGFGIHYLWFFFMASYLIALQKHSQVTNLRGIALVLSVAVLAAGLLLRVALRLRARAVRSNAPAR